jgi:hypothetical protein
MRMTCFTAGYYETMAGDFFTVTALRPLAAHL